MAKDKKIVPFVPTSEREIRTALYFAELRPGEVFLELGCGDGRNLGIAAREFGAVGIGYEIDHELAREARSKTLGLPVTIHQVDFLRSEQDIRKADVVYVYLLQSVNQLIRPMLEENLKPSARVVSLHYTFDGWTPTTTHDSIYFYFSHPTPYQPIKRLAGRDRVRDVITRYKPSLRSKGARVVCMDETSRGLGIYVVTNMDTGIPSEIEGVPVDVKYIG